MKKFLIYFLFLILTVSIPFSVSLAAALKSGKALKINVPFTDDVYVAGGKIDIDSDVAGDLVVAGGMVTVNGKISGDLIAIGGSIDINGEVGDDIRTVGARLTIRGNIGDDLAAAGGNINVESTSVVSGDIAVAGGRVFIYGKTKGDLKGVSSELVIGGDVLGNADIKILEKLKILDGAKIKGNLNYSARKKIKNIEKYVNGKIKYSYTADKAAEIKKTKTLASVLFGFRFFSYLSLLLVGVVLLLVFPNTFESLKAKPGKEVFRDIAAGFIVWAVLMALILVCMASIIGIYFGLLLSLIIPFLVIASKLAVSYTAGSLIVNLDKAGEIKKILVFALGLFIYKIAVILPLIGWAAAGLAVLYMTGRIYKFKKRKYLYLKKRKMI